MTRILGISILANFKLIVANKYLFIWRMIHSNYVEKLKQIKTNCLNYSMCVVSISLDMFKFYCIIIIINLYFHRLRFIWPYLFAYKKSIWPYLFILKILTALDGIHIPRQSRYSTHKAKNPTLNRVVFLLLQPNAIIFLSLSLDQKNNPYFTSAFSPV